MKSINQNLSDVKMESNKYSQSENERLQDLKLNPNRREEFDIYVDSTYIDYMLSNLEGERYKQMKNLKSAIDRVSDDLSNFKKSMTDNVNANENLLFDTRDIANQSKRIIRGILNNNHK